MEINIHLTLGEIELDRAEAMAAMPEKYGKPDIAAVEEQYANAVGYREALHTAFIFHENVEHYLSEHPCVVFDDEAYRLARLAGELLFELYQRLGRLENYETSPQTDE